MIKNLIANGYIANNGMFPLTNKFEQSNCFTKKLFKYRLTDLPEGQLYHMGLLGIEENDIDNICKNFYFNIEVITKKSFILTYDGFVDGIMTEDIYNIEQLLRIEKSVIKEFSDKIYLYNYSYIYLISNGSEIKIGIANNPFTRFSVIQTSSSVKLQLLHVFKIESKFVKKIEKIIHNHFAYKKTSGEWFKLNNIDIDLIYYNLNPVLIDTIQYCLDNNKLFTDDEFLKKYILPIKDIEKSMEFI